MKTLLIFTIVNLLTIISYSQFSDDPCNAGPLPLSATCTPENVTITNAFTETTSPAEPVAGDDGGLGCASIGSNATAATVYAGGDGWFTVERDADGKVEVYATQVAGSDPVIAIYSDLCSGASINPGYTFLGCDDDSGVSLDAFISDSTSPADAGEVIWVRIWDYLGNAGSETYTISASGGTPPANDDCAAAEGLTIGAAAVSGTLYCSTLELSDWTDCEGNTNNNVWYSFTPATSGNTNVNIGPLSCFGSGAGIDVSVFSGGCGAFVSETCSGISSGGGTLSFVATGGTTYWVMVDGDWDGSATTLCDFTISVDQPCSYTNDLCANAVVIPGIVGSDTQQCLSACNEGVPTPNINTAPSACGDISGPVLWYEITTDALDELFDVTVTSTDFDPHILFWTDCSTYISSTGYCDAGAGSASLSSIAVTGNTTYYISVSPMAGLNSGDFDICMTSYPNPCTPSDVCLTPTNVNGGAAMPANTPVCLNNECNVGALGGITATPNCGTVQGGVVWYEFTLGATEDMINITVTSADVTDPLITVWSDCSTFYPTFCAAGTNTATLSGYNAGYGSTVLVSVSSASGSLTGNFDICGETYQNLDACNIDNDLYINSSTPAADGNGNYLPGTTVEFCYDINQYNQVNINFLHGVVPSLGGAYDASTLVATTTPNPAADQEPGSQWAWFPAGTVTYNTLGGLGKYPDGTPMGEGWWFQSTNTPGYTPPIGALDPNGSWGDGCNGSWVTAANAGQCNAAGGTPGSGPNGENCYIAGCYGSETTGMGLTWNFCFSVQTLANYDCVSPMDFGVSVETFADGETGIWTDLGCIVDGPTQLSVPAPTPAQIFITLDNVADPLCNGNSNGEIDAAATGGYGTLLFNIDGGAYSATNAWTGLSAGTYTIGVIDDIGCTATLDVTLNDPAIPASPVVAYNDPLCMGTDLFLTGSPLAGTTVTNYSWTGPSAFTSTTQNPTIVGVTSVNAGTYNLDSDVDGCPATTGSVVVSINDNPVPVISPDPASVCLGFTVAISGGAAGGSGSYAIHDWTGTGIGDLDDATIENPVFTGNTLGAYGLTYTVTDDNGCIGTDNITVTVNPNPTGTISGGGVICAGDAIPDINVVLTGNNPWSITYTDGVTPVTVNGILTSPYVISGGADGSYSLTAVSDFNCTGTFSGNPSITTNPLPTASLAGGGTICAGEPIPDMTITLTGTAPWSITYTDGVTPTTVNGILTSPHTISGASDGNYSITAVSDLNCTGTFSGAASIVTTPLPIAPTVSLDAIYCDGDPLADVTASGSGGTLTWYSDAGLTTVIGTGGSYTPPNTLGATIYYVTETTAGGCEGPASSVTVTINGLPVIDSEVPTDATTCGGADGTITISASGGSGTYSYSIDGGTTFTNTTGVFTGLAVNSYQVVIDDGNCQVTGSILVVSAPSTPAAPVAGTNAVYCEGDVIADLTAATSLGGTLTWYDDAGLTNVVGTGTTFSPTSTAGNYTYYVTETAAGCEGSSSQVTVDVNTVPTATVTGGGTICFGDPIPDVVITLTGSSPWSLTYTDGVTPVTVAPGASPFTLSGQIDGTYEVTAVSDITGCTGTFSGAVDILTHPELTATVSGGGTYCDGSAVPDVTFTLTGTSPWDITYSDGTSSTTINTATSPYTISGGIDGIYTITTITDASGCSSTINGSATITTFPLPVAVVSGGGVICATDPIPDVSITLTGTGPWDVTYEVSGVPTVVTINSSPYVIVGGVDGVYTVTSIVDVNCTGTSNGSATITTNPLPTATISGGGTVCDGDPIPDVDIALTGTGPWNITYFDGTSSVTVSTNVNPYTIIDGADGTYTVTNVSDVNCTGIANGVANIITNPLPTAVVSGGGIICVGDPIPDVVITLTGTSPWSLTYTDGVTPTTIAVVSSPFILSNAADGAYTVTGLTDATTCVGTSLTGLATILTNVLPTATLSGGGTICAGDPIPDITIVLTGATPWNVTYTDGVTPVSVVVNTSPFTISGGADGTYSIVSVSDINCTGTSSGTGTILTNPMPAAPNAGTDATYCFGDPIADLFAVGTGGSLDWFDDAGLTNNVGTGTLIAPPGLIVGTNVYYVTETTLGCQSAASIVTIVLNDLPLIDSEVAVDVSGCNIPDGSITIVASGGVPPYTYSIDGGTTFTNTTGVFTGLDVNSYQIVVADVNCQTVGSLLTITGPGIPPSPVAGTDATYCDGDVIADLTATIGSGGTLSWYDDAALTNLVGNNITFTPSNSVGTATYYVTETVTNCESASTQITITINPTPLAPVTAGGNTYCEGDLIADLTATPAIGGVINWYDDAGLTNLVFTGQVYSPSSAVGTYVYYAVESLNGCDGPSSLVNVVIRPTPVFTVADTSPSTCSGADGELLIAGLVAGNSYTVSYSENGTPATPISTTADVNGEILISGLSAGTYTFVTVDLNGCSTTDVNTFTLVDPSMPTFTIVANNPTVCAGLDGSLVLSGLDPSTSYDIDYNDDGLPISINVPSDGTGEIIIGGLDAGVYTDVAVTLNGCATTLAGPYNLVDPNAPTFTVGATVNPSGCGVADASITLNGLDPSTTYNLTYNVNGVPVGPASITTDVNGDWVISGIQGGTYDGVTIELSNCTSTDAGVFILAPIYPTAPIAFTDSTYCEGDVIADLNGIPAFGGTMTWYDDAGLANQVGAGSAYTVLDTAPGVYVYYVTETLNNCEGPSSTVTVIISATPVQPGISADASYCEGDTAADMVATPNSGGQIIWYSDALLTDSIGSGTMYTPSSSVGAVTYYIVEVVNSCVSVSYNTTITVNPNPIASFTPTPSSGNVPLDVDLDNTTVGAGTYTWDLGDGTSSTATSPSVTYSETGEFSVVLNVVDGNGCIDSTSAVIIVEGVSTLVIPNIFTPNGDGSNDVFNLSGTNITEIKGTIMNRWGQVVYQFNTLEAGWTGRTVAGLEAAEGTYFYIIDAVGADGEEYNYQGPFELIR